MSLLIKQVVRLQKLGLCLIYLYCLLPESTPRPSTAEETNELPSLSKNNVRVGSDADSKAFYTSEDDTEPANNLIDVLSPKKPTLSATSDPAVSRCTHSRLYRHVTLIGGLRAGNFTRMADHVDMDECSRKCCAQRSCNLAILMRDTCFGLHCSSPELCSTRPARLRGFSLKIMYIYREDSKGRFPPLMFYFTCKQPAEK